jgi:hypothetical protein
MGMKRNRRELGAAWAADEVVIARRSLWKADPLEGFVVDLTRSWAALHVVYDVGLNGWSIVRLDTVKAVERHPADAFLPRALRWAGEEPEPIDVDLDRPRTLISSLSTAFPILTIFTEEDDPASSTIGRPVHLGSRSVRVLGMDADARWSDEPRRLRYDAITRIDVGGRFETALHHLGGFPPVPG